MNLPAQYGGNFGNNKSKHKEFLMQKDDSASPVRPMYQWISWVQPTEDARPITYPPNAAILWWWETGTFGDGAATLCALVKAPDEQAARTAVLEDWPEAERWRFCEAREDTKTGDRFPPTKWMLERMSA